MSLAVESATVPCGFWPGAQKKVLGLVGGLAAGDAADAPIAPKTSKLNRLSSRRAFIRRPPRSIGGRLVPRVAFLKPLAVVTQCGNGRSRRRSARRAGPDAVRGDRVPRPARPE